ncbi:AAA family ATPase [Stenotrophomonas sp. PAMC25021]|uniref:AAA family ATPase n=1 Tax=Stenotrophomonas sp. PAMC25021 TaxID=2565559 RepID=UPI001B352A6F|nr:AAA family ATPase [Stenotrophomonas sp. PAMC25021]
MNTTQTIKVDPEVTVFVGMNEAGKTVVLKALQKCRDALGEDKFQVIEDYPRKDLASYTKRHAVTPATAAVLTYRLDDSEVAAANAELHTSLPNGFEFSVKHRYDNKSEVILKVDEGPVLQFIRQQISTDASEALEGATQFSEVPEMLAETALTAADSAILQDVNRRIAAAGSDWSSVVSMEVYQQIASSIPKFLYFSEYDLLPGKINLADLTDRVVKAKSDPKQLQPKHRAVLALLRMADVAVADLSTPSGYEELKAKIEGVSINLTDQVMEFWRQNEDLEVEVDIKTDQSDEAPFNNGPNLYLRIKNRRHRGVSTPFDQRSRGFIWFFSFLVWFDSVQQQLEPIESGEDKRLILLLDEPGLALHALAQADFLRYIDSLSGEHQVLYTTHSPFMVHSDRLHQVRLVEDRKVEGSVISENLMGADSRTIFPLQAALGWTIAQNLFISKRNLLVEGPSELNYLQAVSALLEASGGGGLREDITIVPTGGLDNLATFVSLLNASGLQLAILHDYKGSPEQKLTGLVRDKLLSSKAIFNASQFRDLSAIGTDGRPSDIEDLLPAELYLEYFNSAFAKVLGGRRLTVGDLGPGDRVILRIEAYLKAQSISLRPTGGYNHYLPSTKFASTPPDALDADTAARFRAMFSRINAIYD